MRFENDSNEAILELERQRTQEIYESAGDYRCENGCSGEQDLFFVEEHIFCRTCFVEFLHKAAAEIMEIAKLAKEDYAEVFDMMADILDDMSEAELVNYAEYYYSRVE